MPASNDLAAAVGAAAHQELNKGLGRLRHAVDQLTDAQIWSRSAESMNSIGNLILHLGGNLRQWIIAGVGGARDTRERSKEFTERGPIAREKLLQRLQAVIDEAGTVLAQVTERQLLEVRRIQKFDVNGLAALFNCVPHFQGHVQEIIHMTRELLGDAYKFAGPPPEKLAPV